MLRKRHPLWSIFHRIIIFGSNLNYPRCHVYKGFAIKYYSADTGGPGIVSQISRFHHDASGVVPISDVKPFLVTGQIWTAVNLVDYRISPSASDWGWGGGLQITLIFIGYRLYRNYLY